MIIALYISAIIGSLVMFVMAKAWRNLGERKPKHCWWMLRCHRWKITRDGWTYDKKCLTCGRERRECERY